MNNKSKKILAEISAGELLDKLTILEIKLYKIENLEKKKVIKEEIKVLKEVIDKFVDWNKNKDVTMLFGNLRQTNEKLWVIEFPTLDGATEWINAEMAPPYGSYGNYEYHLAYRSIQHNHSQLVTHPRKIIKTENTIDPNNLPNIREDKNSVLVLIMPAICLQDEDCVIIRDHSRSF